MLVSINTPLNTSGDTPGNTSRPPLEIKALVFDLDGTLLAPGAILTERTIRAVRAAARKGLEIIFATGRAVEASEKYRAALDARGAMVYFNGAIVSDMPANRILHTTLLDKNIADFCLDLSRGEKVYFQIYAPETRGRPGQPLLAETDYPEREMYHKHTGILAELCDLKELLGAPDVSGCVKAMFLAEPEVLDRVRPVVESRFGKDVYVVRSTRTFLEILNPGVSKGTGLALALKYRGIDPKETIVFGDEENDLPMFGLAGLSVAPANAKDSVKSKADLVIGSNAEDGIAAFLEKTF